MKFLNYILFIFFVLASSFTTFAHDLKIQPLDFPATNGNSLFRTDPFFLVWQTPAGTWMSWNGRNIKELSIPPYAGSAIGLTPSGKVFFNDTSESVCAVVRYDSEDGSRKTLDSSIPGCTGGSPVGVTDDGGLLYNVDIGPYPDQTHYIRFANETGIIFNFMIPYNQDGVRSLLAPSITADESGDAVALEQVSQPNSLKLVFHYYSRNIGTKDLGVEVESTYKSCTLSDILGNGDFGLDCQRVVDGSDSYRNYVYHSTNNLFEQRDFTVKNRALQPSEYKQFQSAFGCGFPNRKIQDGYDLAILPDGNHVIELSRNDLGADVDYFALLSPAEYEKALSDKDNYCLKERDLLVSTVGQCSRNYTIPYGISTIYASRRTRQHGPSCALKLEARSRRVAKKLIGAQVARQLPSEKFYTFNNQGTVMLPLSAEKDCGFSLVVPLRNKSTHARQVYVQCPKLGGPPPTPTPSSTVSFN